MSQKDISHLEQARILRKAEDPCIQKGSVLVYRVFDIAEEIDLNRVERILSKEHGQSRIRLTRNPRQALVMRNPPLRLSLGEQEIVLRSRRFRADTYATIYDYGVLSIVFQIPIQGGTLWSELVRDSETLAATGDVTLDRLGEAKAKELAAALLSALKTPAEIGLYEDYVIYFLEEIEEIRTSTELLERADIPSLILAEPREVLGKKSRSGILENSFQYAENDLAVIDWNSAIVWEPSGQRDIPDILEFAVTHLLEFRYYDDLLDSRLAEMYDAFETRRASRLLRSRFGGIYKEANSRFIEFSEFIERIDNSLKVVGDFYLAVIFRGAIRRFRIPDWQQSVTRKMNLFARVSELLQGEMNVRRGHMLELIIILLIAFEILSALR